MRILLLALLTVGSFTLAGCYDTRMSLPRDGGSPPADAGSPPPDSGSPPSDSGPSCTPDCVGRACGDDGCGGTCGTCPSGRTCTAAGVCSAVPSTGEDCLDATVIPAEGGSFTFDFAERTADHTPFSCGSTTGQPDVAFVVTPVGRGTAIFETSGTADVVMAVFSSFSCTNANELACDDDGAGVGWNSRIELSVTEGRSYYVVIAPYGTSTPPDSVTLHVSLPI